MVVWDKEQALPSFSQVELAWTSFDLPSKIFRIAQAGFRRKDRTTAIIHPTQKPVELYRGLLATFAEPGFRILDTHGGSMTHAIACHDYGYELRIVERDEFYYREAVNRLKWYQRQQAIVF
jgi:site-specific DNA-methyltransferase (adenine-specific)